MRPNILSLFVSGLLAMALAGCQHEDGSGAVPASSGSVAISKPEPAASTNIAPSAGPSPAVGHSSPLTDADWPHFRGSDGTGIARDIGINKAWGVKTPIILWKAQLSDDGYAGPAVAGGKVYIVDHEGASDVVRCLDLRSGKDIWRFPYLDARDDNSGFARATPTVDTGRVYTLSRLGALNCLDADTGLKVWSRNIITDFVGKRPRWDLATSPVIDGDRLIVCPGGTNAAVAVLKKQTGELIWKGAGSDVAGYATPVVAQLNGRKQYIFFNASGLMGVEPDGGKVLWQLPWKTEYDVNAATPLVIDDAVFITSGYGTGCAMIDVTPTGARVRWKNKEIQSHFNTPIYSAGYIYGTSDPGDLVCLNAKTGTSTWRHPGFEKGGVAAADGALVALSGSNGTLTLLKLAPEAYLELGSTHPLSGQSWTAPVIGDGRLIVRNKQEMACLDIK